jgi:hypothetical protein
VELRIRKLQRNFMEAFMKMMNWMDDESTWAKNWKTRFMEALILGLRIGLWN